MKAYYATDVGKIRSHNEDNVIAVATTNKDYLLVVSDGMGGHRAGEVASMITTTYLADNFMDKKFETKEEAIAWLQSSITIINKKIVEYTNQNPETKGMGTTVVVAIITSNFTIMGNIGDSSGYIIQDEHIKKITYDHTLVNVLVAAGELTEAEAKFHPRKNILMKALGSNEDITIDIYEINEKYDSILLCSDGLTNMVSDQEILQIATSENDLQKLVDRLIAKANNRGGNDNISVAYFDKEEL